MKKWMTLIELVAVIAILATIMGIGSIRLVRSQENKWARQEITTVYNTFTSHNRNISRWKAWSRERSFSWSWDNNIINEINITQSNGSWRTIVWDKISFNYCSWTIILWKDIRHEWECTWAFPYFSTLYICEDDATECSESSDKLLAEIQFHEVTNNISLIRTWKFKQTN